MDDHRELVEKFHQSAAGERSIAKGGVSQLTAESNVSVTIRSPITGRLNTMTLPTSMEKIERFRSDRHSCPLIQHYFPELSADQREFVLTGCTPEDYRMLGDD